MRGFVSRAPDLKFERLRITNNKREKYRSAAHYSLHSLHSLHPRKSSNIKVLNLLAAIRQSRILTCRTERAAKRQLAED